MAEQVIPLYKHHTVHLRPCSPQMFADGQASLLTLHCLLHRHAVAASGRLGCRDFFRSQWDLIAFPHPAGMCPCFICNTAARLDNLPCQVPRIIALCYPCTVSMAN